MNEEVPVYSTPVLMEGNVIEIYACNQGTCNGKSRNVIAEKSDEELEKILI